MHGLIGLAGADEQQWHRDTPLLFADHPKVRPLRWSTTRCTDQRTHKKECTLADTAQIQLVARTRLVNHRHCGVGMYVIMDAPHKHPNKSQTLNVHCP